MQLFTPKGFLQLGGGVLVLVAILGYVGIIGPAPENSIFGGFWYFDNVENLAHLVLGIVALGAAFWLGSDLQKPLVILVGVVAVLAGLWSLFVSSTLLGAGLENPADTVLHLIVGAWALYAGLGKQVGGGMM